MPVDAIDGVAGLIAIVPTILAIRRLSRATLSLPIALILLSGVTLCLGQVVAMFAPQLLSLPGGLRHVVTMAAYPPLLAGLALLPPQPLERTSARRIIVGGLLLVAAISAFSWFFLIGPLLLTVHPAIVGLLRTIYAVADLALILAIYLLSARSRSPSLSPPVTALAAGAAIIVLADTAIGLVDLVRLGDMSWAHVSRGAGFAVIGLATVWYASQARVIPVERGITRPTDATQVWRYVLPYVMTAGVVILLIWVAGGRALPQLKLGTYVIGSFLIELVFLYQYLAWRELVAYVNRSVRLESQAAQDSVTGLPHHRTLVNVLDRELDRAHRYGHPCSLLFLDLDHFKSLNDSYGHQTGDSALREFATVVRTVLRGADTMGRWGGEEFVVILPESTAEAAHVAADRVRTAVAGHSFSVVGGGAHITCSIGVATYPHDARDRDGLIKRADEAMYAAKQLGRNQVRMAGDPGLEEMEGIIVRSREDTSLLGAVEALVAMVETSGRVPEEHIHAVATVAQRLGLQLGLDTTETYMLGLAAQLHDVGMAGLPDGIVRKVDPLTPDEWERMREHAALGAEIVSKIPALRPLAPIIRFHHERWDGDGYPDHLSGERIPLGARILAVAEVYGFLTTDTPYRPATPARLALSEIQHHAGTQFDPLVVLALERAVQGDIVEALGA